MTSMNLLCQKEALESLQKFADSDKHSIMISGTSGCGKTYLASVYGKMLGIQDQAIVSANVNEIRSTIDECSMIDNAILICVENLDSGAIGASYALLKFLEEPAPNVYIVITCRNSNRIPDTIISRSSLVYIAPPLPADIAMYGKSKDESRYSDLHDTRIWKCAKSFQNVDTIFSMSSDQLTYFATLKEILKCNSNISTLCWKLGHYDDNTEVPLDLVMNYIVANIHDAHIQRSAMTCISDLATSRIAKHAILARFLFECKYCE